MEGYMPIVDNHNILDFQDPGVAEEAMFDMPGFVHELTEYTLSQSPSPNRRLAFLGALSMMAHLAGRKYTDVHGTRPNLYLVVLAETGVGKDAPRTVNRELATALGTPHAVEDSVSSGQALEDIVAEQPVLLFQSDEVETLMGSMKGSGRNAAALSERMRRLFSSSNGFYKVRSTTKHPNGALVPYPSLTLFGTGTPEAFYRMLDARAIVNGLYGRCLVIEVKDEYRSNTPIVTPIPESIVRIAQWHADNERAIRESDHLDLITVTESSEATMKLKMSADTLVEMRKRLAESELSVARALTVRTFEKISKCAMLYAISENPEQPVITGAAVDWAIKFVTHIVKGMLYESQFHAGEGKFDTLTKRFLGLLAKHGGSLDRRRLYKSLHVDPFTFNRIVLALHMCDEIIEDTECGKMPIYTLKSAA